MPQLGESVTEGSIGKWLVGPGDRVTKYQPIAEVITDKVNAEIPAPADGVIESLAIGEGATVAVGTLIATMQATEGVAAGAAAGPAAGPAASPTALPAAPAPDRAANGARYSPVVMRLAQEHQIDLAGLSGSGLGGRVTRKDVEAFLASGGPARQAPPSQLTAAEAARSQGASSAPAGPAAPAPTRQAAPPPQPLAADQVIPVDGVRRRIAAKMRQSKDEAPHAWTMMPVDVTGLVRLKEQQGEEYRRKEGLSLSYMPFFIKAVVESLKEFPIINSQWAGESIIVKKEINISVAVATETALAVPVIHQADRLSIAGLNQAVHDLATRARAGRLTVEDVSGGTFTVNNTGFFGSYMSAPIINHPQAAILSFEAITKMPVVIEGDAIAIRSIMNLCMSLDHRVLDGLVCGRFLQAVRVRLESYGPGSVTLF